MDPNEEPPNLRELLRAPFGRGSPQRPGGSRFPRCEPLPRGLARAIDLALAFLPMLLGGGTGVVVGALFLLLSDGLFEGQSPGKKLLGVKVVSARDYTPGGMRESALRNWPFAGAPLLSFVPCIGLPLALGTFAALAGLETIRMLQDELGLRKGDQLAETQVVDTKVLVGRAAERGQLTGDTCG